MTAVAGADGRAAGMRDRATLDFILARVIREWVTDRAPILPLLGEAPTRQPRACPKPGHGGLMVARPDGGARCSECERERKAARRRG